MMLEDGNKGENKKKQDNKWNRKKRSLRIKKLNWKVRGGGRGGALSRYIPSDRNEIQTY